jgi:ubiquinone/menaquinone biosynthesis C-methylase UbiE
MNNIINTIKSYEDKLGHNDFKFLERIYKTESKIYNQRLNAIEFRGFDKVLDIGCGFGQWSIELSKLNNKVISTDLSSIRLVIAEAIANQMSIKNIEFKHSNLNDIKLRDEEVDAIFAYGCIYFIEIRKALEEFNRVLKKGGVVYFNTNGLGWALNLWLSQPNSADDYNPKKVAVDCFNNSVKSQNKEFFEGQQICEKNDIIKLIKETGFELLNCKGEGLINTTNKNYDYKPFFKEFYHGFEGVTEYLIKKK